MPGDVRRAAAKETDKMPALKHTLPWLFAVALVLVAAGYAAYVFTPWPSALLIRRAFDRGGIESARALEKHVPAGVAAVLDARYDANDRDALLDVFHPGDAGAGEGLPTIVWIHGGAFLSGSKDHIAPYLRILAARGFTVVGVDYSLAPASTYPTPVRQVNTALTYLTRNAARLHVDPSKLFLAGDSAGSQLAAQLALVIIAPSYAAEVGIVPSVTRAQLRGVILFCGVYGLEQVDPDSPFGKFQRAMLWSYFGAKDFLSDPRLAQFSLAGHITADFPPLFISVGNGDTLQPQSRRLAEAALRQGVPVDALFFPESRTPALPHEYQFNLDDEAGRLALERASSFVREQAK